MTLGFSRQAMALFIIAFVSFKGSSFAKDQAALDAKISQMGDAIHVEIIGIKEWEYKLTESEQGGKQQISLEIPSLNESSIKVLEQWKSPLISSVVYKGPAAGSKASLTFVGADNRIESFDYLTDQPARLILDIFPSAETAKVEPPKATPKPRARTAESISKDIEVLKEAYERLPASDLTTPSAEGLLLMTMEDPEQKIKGGIFDGADPEFSRFSIANHEISEEAIIKSRENVYLHFPMLELENHHLKRLRDNPPEYEVREKAGEENKFARLLVTLFKNKRNAVFLKASEWFKQKYPNSEYNELIAFMTADTYYRLWIEARQPEDYERAITAYRQALAAFPETTLLERTTMLMGFSALEMGDPLSTLRIFQSYLKENPESANFDIAQLAMAEAYISLRKFRDAEKIYDQISENGSSIESKIEAKFLKGNVFTRENNYEKAIAAYQEALDTYPDDWGKYPNAFYNSAEALFWKGRYKESLDKYRDYIRRFPTHPHAGYAMTRLGEILEILGAEPTRVLGAYLEAHFRYGVNEGAGIARMRFLSERMAEMKKREVVDAVQEINEIVERSDLPKVQEFSRVMIADGFWRRKEYDAAIQALAEHYQRNPIGTNTDVLSQRIVRYINDDIQSKVESGNNLEALKTHSQYFETWLKQSKRIDTPFHLAQAFEKAGVPSEAERVYKDALNKLQAIEGTHLEKERGIFEELPKIDTVNLRLAVVALQQNRDKDSFRYLKAIKDPQSLTIPEQLERVEIASRILEKQGDLKTARLYVSDLIERWKSKPGEVGPAYLRFAELSYKEKDLKPAEQALQVLLNLQEDTDKLKGPIHSKALDLMSQVKFDLGDMESAKKHLTLLLDSYESESSLPLARYRLGEIQFNEGNIQQAKSTWEKLDEKKDNFWWSLAKEKLDSLEWQQEYQRYVERIPAMAGKD